MLTLTFDELQDILQDNELYTEGEWRRLEKLMCSMDTWNLCNYVWLHSKPCSFRQLKKLVVTADRDAYHGKLYKGGREYKLEDSEIPE